MPNEIIKTTGPLKTANPTVGGGAAKNLPVFGIVKDNIDPTRSGRIKVLIGEKSPQDSDNSDSWVTVSFLSNFFGKIDGSGGKDTNGTYKANPTSYGEWHAPPDIGTKVICIFVNGDPNYGFYIGCVPEPETLQMVPAIGSSDKVQLNDSEAKSYGGATRLPVTNFNTNNKGLANSGTFNESTRPVHSYSAAIMNQQGIIRDPIRGPISSSASREPASRVGWGVSTPGRPIYDGGFDDSTVVKNLDPSKGTQLKVVARRGGHSFVMDDGDIIGRDQLIRIRTALGHQILMSDDGQTLMILHSNGQSYIELGKEGTVDIFSTNSFNVRTQGDINFHADRNINLHAMENVSIQGKVIQTNSEEKTKIRAGSDINMAATGKLTGLAGGPIAWGAGGEASLVAGGQAFVNGSKVNLNSGSPGTSPDPVTPIPLIAQTDTLYDKEKGFMASPGKLLSIASRAPAHAPWANAGQGVDIKTSMNASDNLPKTASPAASATNQAAQSTNPAAPATATVASAPTGTPPVSKAINKNVTAAAVAQTATQAAASPVAAATKAGAAIVPTQSGNVCAVGSFALTPSQLEAGGALKPGASTLVNTLVQAGKTIEQALPKAVFSGLIAGATNLTSLIESTTAQATTLVNTFQKAQSALGAVGVITGKEAPTQITGFVTAAATEGVGPVINAVKEISAVTTSFTNTLTSVTNVATSVENALTSATNIAAGAAGAGAAFSGAASSLSGAINGAATNLTGSLNSLTGSLNGAVSGVTGALNSANKALGTAQGALKAIGAGGAAAKLTETIGGLGGIQSALTAMGSVPSLSSLVDQAEGVATSAFNAIKQSFKSLKANVPQNLTQIAKENAAAAASVASTTGSQGPTNLLNQVGSSLSSLASGVAGVTGAASKITSAVGGITSGITSITGAVGGITNTLGSLNNSISGITGAISSASNSLSTIAGAATSVTNTLNDLTAVVNTVATTATNAINTTVGGVENAINAVGAFAGSGPTMSGGGLPALSNAASVVQQGAQAAVSSMLASGLSNLPGGINTVANITNNAIGAINVIPGTSALTSAIKNATSSVMNGVSTLSSATNALGSLATSIGSATNSINNVTGSINGALTGATSALNDINKTIGGVSGQISGALSGIQSKLNGLSSLAATGLPVGAIAQLQSAISSLAGGAPGAISLPSIGFNTTDRGSITAQIIDVLGDIGIPQPNLVGEIKQEVKEELDANSEEFKKKYSELEKKVAEFTVEDNKLKQAFFDAVNTYGEMAKEAKSAFKKWNGHINGAEGTALREEAARYIAAKESSTTTTSGSTTTTSSNSSSTKTTTSGGVTTTTTNSSSSTVTTTNTGG